MGSFIARISRGRTIREFVLGVMIVIAAFPFMLLMVVMAYSLHRDMAMEARRLAEKERLLRESEKEAERQAEEESHPTSPEAPVPQGQAKETTRAFEERRHDGRGAG